MRDRAVSSSWLPAWASIESLLLAEARNVRRDPLLRWMAVLPPVSALLLRWLVPVIDARLEVDLQPYAPLIMSVYAIGLVPVVMGFVVGLMLLDERDEGTLDAVRVTPLTLEGYLACKLSLPVIVTTLLTLACFPLAGLLPFRASFVPPVLLSALWAPMLALMMASFATNKIQGFVLMRASNVLVGLPVLAWFVSGWSRYAFGVLPSFWPLEAFWRAAEGQSSWIVVSLGLVVHAACLWWLLRRFRQAVGRA
jgi:fluoroquinolone transport system permease protein